MPIYEYHCTKCGHNFELVRRIAQIDDAAPCPECRSKRTKRRVSLFITQRGAAPDLMASDDIDPIDLPEEDHWNSDKWKGDYWRDDE